MQVAKPAPRIEWIRGPDLASYKKKADGVPMEEALRQADVSGHAILSNNRLSKALTGREWKDIREVFPCWTGTMSAYEEPEQKLGATIEYNDTKTGIRYIFPVPSEHRGKRNVVLVAEHPDFTIESDGNDRVVQANMVGAISDFPVFSGNWHRCDQTYGIPQGSKVEDSDPYAMYLWRIRKRVGLVARGYSPYWKREHRRDVSLANEPSGRFGVAVEAIRAASQKIEAVRLSPDKLMALVENAEICVSELSHTLKPEKLEAIRLLLQALKIKG